MLTLRLRAIGALLFAIAGIAWAAAPDVRITMETGFHSGPIRALAINPENRYFVTVGDDRTARLWSLKGGERLRVLRPPQDGDGQSGRLWAVAISPDGSQIALGGFTRVASQPRHPIYLFSQDGRLLRRVQGAGNAVAELAFSPDGQYLAGCQQGGVLAVWLVAGETNAAMQQPTGKGDCRGLAWRGSDRVITANNDGNVRTFRVSERQLQPDGPAANFAPNRPWRIALSPDGGRLAVGLEGTVVILEAKSLRKLSKQLPESAGTTPPGGAFASVVWSTDGHRLCAAGSVGDARKGTVLRCWRDEGAPFDLPVSQDSVTALAALPGSAMLVATAAPEIVRVEGDGSNSRKTLLGATLGIGFHDLERFEIAGGVLTMHGRESKVRRRFDPSLRLVSESGPDAGNLRPSLDTALADRCLSAFQEGTRARIAVSDALTLPGSSALICAGSLGVWQVDASGKVKGVPLRFPVAAYSLTAGARPGQFAVALGDGTVRWVRASDMTVILTLFIVRDRPHWVAWTASGYFDASPGAENLFGWEIWRGVERSMNFFAAGRFRDERYRPGIAAAILDEGNEAAALRRLGETAAAERLQGAPVQAERMPPTIELIDEADVPCAPRGCVIRFRARGELTKASWRTLPDGVETPIDLAKDGLARQSQQNVHSVVLSPPRRSMRLRIEARNAYGAAEALEVSVSPFQQGKERERPVLYLLAIGADVQRGSDIGELNYASDDARAIVESFEKQKGPRPYPFSDVKIWLLDGKVGPRPQRDEILKAIKEIREASIGTDDMVLVFVAGHGVKGPDGRYFFWAAGARRDSLVRTGLSGEELRRMLAGVPARVMLWIDTCHAGDAVDHMGWIASLTETTSRLTVMSASMGQRSSLEDARWATEGFRGHGAFTRAVLEAMSQAGDQSLNKISFKDIDAYVSRRVPELTGGAQTPITPLNLSGDFTIALRPQGGKR